MIAIRDDTHMTSMKIASPHPPFPSTSKIFLPLDSGRPISNELPRNRRKGTMEEQARRACEQMKSKEKQKQVTSHSN